MKDEVKLFFVGDIVISQESSIDLVFDKSVCDFIHNHDSACCNFEGAIASEQMKPVRKVGPPVRQNACAAEILYQAGFRILNLANNHIMDYGESGLRNTEDKTKQFSIIGASSQIDKIYQVYIEVIRNKRIGYISVAENGFGCATSDTSIGYAWMLWDGLNEIIRDAKNKVDILIVNCHAGAEHWRHPLPELRKIYRSWVNMGADIIIGHHPHIVQGWEKYQKGFIFYSLGNFYFDPQIGVQHPKTIGVSININKDNAITEEIGYFERDSVTGKLRFSEDENFAKDLQNCNEELANSKVYDSYISDACVKAYDKMYRSYYARVNGLYLGGLKARLKSFIRRNIMREKFSDMWLYHNLEIETHLWITKRALTDLKDRGLLI